MTSPKVGHINSICSQFYPQGENSPGRSCLESDLSADDDIRMALRMDTWRKRKQERRQHKLAAQEKGLIRTCSEASDAFLEQSLISRGVCISGVTFLQEGNFARVYKALWRRDGTEEALPAVVKAVKTRHCCSFPTASGDVSLPTWLQREASFLKIVEKHPHLVQFFGVELSMQPFVLLMEYCAGGDLHHILYSHSGTPPTPTRALSWVQRKQFSLDIASGMSYLHACGAMHRDLKPQNVLAVAPVADSSSRVHAKVGDFGISRPVVAGAGGTREVGTWIYMAPEIFTSGAYDEKVDVFSFGIVLYELIADAFPYGGRYGFGSGSPILGAHVARGARPDISIIPEAAPSAILELMAQAWASDAEERPSFDFLWTALSEVDVSRIA